MITTHEKLTEAGTIPVVGLPPDTVVERLPLADGGVVEVALVAIPAAEPAAHDAVIAELVGRAGSWVTAATPGGDPPLVVPLYGTSVVWSPRRAAAVGPADRLAAMRSALVEFADREAELRDIEWRIAAALEHVDHDAAVAFEADEQALPRRREMAAVNRAASSFRRGRACSSASKATAAS